MTCTVTSVTQGTYKICLRQRDARTGHISGLFLLFPLCVSISHSDMGLMCGGGVKEAQSEGLSLYSAHPHTHKCKYTHTHMHRQFRLNWTTTEFCKHYRPHPHLYTSTHPEQKGFKCCHTHHRVPECVRRPPRNRGRIKTTSVTSSPAADFVILLGCCKQRRTEHQTGCSVSVCVFV